MFSCRNNIKDRLPVDQAWLDGHGQQADVAWLRVVEVIHAPELRPEPLDDLRHGLVDGLAPRRRPLSDRAARKRVAGAPRRLLAGQDLPAVQVEAKVVVQL
jgi:hypothetical protein